MAFTRIDQLSSTDEEPSPISSKAANDGQLCVSTPIIVLFVGMSILMVALSAIISAFICRTAAAGRTKLGQFLVPSETDVSVYPPRPPSQAAVQIVAQNVKA